ncbi:hypothetical protein WR25_13752 [Diploscapter pachys]|uniref:Uncharacterized protein n=1 Tax=Diploscapter pachys TaxID=2018661 RepID=A0A2A2K4A5_9BILA|nr:hypothetical protein WR25_13752 [Diploscapter pachys]
MNDPVGVSLRQVFFSAGLAWLSADCATAGAVQATIATIATVQMRFIGPPLLFAPDHASAIPTYQAWTAGGVRVLWRDHRATAQCAIGGCCGL